MRDSVVFAATDTNGTAWTNQGAVLGEYLGTTYHRRGADLSSYSSACLRGHCTVVGAAGAYVGIQASLDGGASWVWLTDGTSGASGSVSAKGPALSLAATGVLASSVVTLHSSVKTSVLLRLVGDGGDGVADPRLSAISLELS